MKKVMCLLSFLMASSVFSLDFSNTEKILKKDFIHEFPATSVDKNVTNIDNDISGMSEQEQEFYKNKVGSYVHKNLLEEDSVERNLYSINLSSIENGIKFFKFGKYGTGINYNFKGKSFYMFDGGASETIKDISSFEFYDKDSVRIDSDDFYTKVVEKKRNECKSLQNKNVNDKKLRKFLISYFKNLSKDDFGKKIDTFIEFDNFKEIKNDKSCVKIEKSNFIKEFDFHRQILSACDDFSVYVNVYYSESPKLIKENFGDDCVLVEFDYGLSYMSFVVKEVDSKLKIIGLRYEMDEE